MILYYAMGGGLGHLTRARAVLHTLEIEKGSAILTSSDFANDIRVVGDSIIVPIPKHFEKNVAAFRLWLAETFEALSVTETFIDTFPAGIIGEFCDFNFAGIKINYVARLLRWKAYAPLLSGNLPHFQNTFLLEPLEEAHENFIAAHSQNHTSLDLDYPLSTIPTQAEQIVKNHSPFWVIVHSGKEEEVNELLSYADEMRVIENQYVNLILIAPSFSLPLPQKTFHYDLYPASLLFPKTERIISGCGFNIMNQARTFRDKHFMIPFPRRYDNQNARAKLCRTLA